MGAYDGFCPSNYKSEIEVIRIDYEMSHVRIIVKNKREVDHLAEELSEKDSDYSKSRSNVRM
jgi:galactose-1-phosphate uridylyltransferase